MRSCATTRLGSIRLRGVARLATATVTGSTPQCRAAILVGTRATLESIRAAIARDVFRCSRTALIFAGSSPLPWPPLLANGHLATATRILFVGRLVAFKALGLLLEAIARVQHAGNLAVRLEVIGDGPMACGLDG